MSKRTNKPRLPPMPQIVKCSRCDKCDKCDIYDKCDKSDMLNKCDMANKKCAIFATKEKLKYNRSLIHSYRNVVQFKHSEQAIKDYILNKVVDTFTIKEVVLAYRIVWLSYINLSTRKPHDEVALDKLLTILEDVLDNRMN